MMMNVNPFVDPSKCTAQTCSNWRLPRPSCRLSLRDKYLPYHLHHLQNIYHAWLVNGSCSWYQFMLILSWEVVARRSKMLWVEHGHISLPLVWVWTSFWYKLEAVGSSLDERRQRSVGAKDSRFSCFGCLCCFDYYCCRCHCGCAPVVVCSNWPHPQIVFWAQEHNFWWPWKWFRFTLPRPAGLHRPEALFEFGKSKSDGIGLILPPIAGCSRSNTLCIGRNYPSDGKVCQVDRWRQLLGAMILLNLMFNVYVIRACLKCIICIDLLHVWMPVNASLHLFARAAQAWHLPTLATSCTCRRCSLHARVSCIRYHSLFAVGEWGCNPQDKFAHAETQTETWHLMRTFTVYRVKRISYWLQGCRHAQITWRKQNLSIRSKNLWLQGLCGWVGYIACSGTASVGFACRSWQVDTEWYR